VREVGKAAGMVEVEVRHDNVLDGFGSDAQAGNLADRRAVRILVAAEIEAKEADLQARGVVVVKA